MDELERLIKAARELQGAGATGVKLTGGSAPTLEATFPPPVAIEAKPQDLTPEELAAERERVLLHST